MMFLNGNNVFIGSNKTVAQIKGFNVDIVHWCSSNKSYNEYAIIDNRWIDDVGAKYFVVPRAVMARTSYSIVLDNFDDNIMLIDMTEDNNDECVNCPYSEDCNGQICFFSMI